MKSTFVANIQFVQQNLTQIPWTTKEIYIVFFFKYSATLNLVWYFMQLPQLPDEKTLISPYEERCCFCCQNLKRKEGLREQPPIWGSGLDWSEIKESELCIPLTHRKLVLRLSFDRFFSRPLPKAGRELQTELNTMNNGGGGGGGPLAKNQPEASLIAVSQL